MPLQGQMKLALLLADQRHYLPGFKWRLLAEHQVWHIFNFIMQDEGISEQ